MILITRFGNFGLFGVMNFLLKKSLFLNCSVLIIGLLVGQADLKAMDPAPAPEKNKDLLSLGYEPKDLQPKTENFLAQENFRKNWNQLSKEEKSFCESKFYARQWDPLDSSRGVDGKPKASGKTEERELLKKLFSEGLDPKKLDARDDFSLLRLGLLSPRPTDKESVLSKIEEHYKAQIHDDNFWKFPKDGGRMACGEKKALDAQVVREYQQIKDLVKQKKELKIDAEGFPLTNYLNNCGQSVGTSIEPPNNRKVRINKDIFKQVVAHLEHCFEGNRSELANGAVKREFKSMIDALQLFFNRNVQGYGYIGVPGSGVTLESFNDREIRSLFNNLCRYSEHFKETYADETFMSRLSHGNTLGLVAFGLGALISAGLWAKNRLDCKNSYKILSKREKRIKTRQTRRIILASLVLGTVLGAALAVGVNDKLSVKFLDVKTKLNTRLVT